jgi:methylmalonyl-CoA mutase
MNKENNDWQIRQNFVAEDYKNTNLKIVKALENGMSALGIIIKHHISKEDFEVLLNNVYLNMISIHLVAENNLTAAIAAFKSFCEARNEATENLSGSFSVGHIGDIATTIQLIAQYQKAFPAFKFITITSENTGIVDELTHAFKTAHQYFSESEIEKPLLATTIQFKVFVGTEYFFEIAKLRAYRVLWQKLLSLHQVAQTPAFIQAEKSWLHNDDADAHKNILRHTTEAMSAAVGGCDVLCLQSIDTTQQLNNDFFNRIAVNIQHLLKEESHFDKVTDIAAGSYYIETITQQIVEKVWANIQP